ncbi:retrovirus-related pol polyprotein from transposon TNT 1-94 [Tanacetum coccineum]|uniref:Retrovirus-related pol polyprotein from transposon TNT 1-94 n=1 Tax=Tanacetum coccineum TaxID=301880 RepID=A0ABQ4Z0H1_9ASTR
MGLESLEARIVVQEKNEAVYEEDIAFLKYDVQLKYISIKDLKNQLEEALKEKDDLKLKLENFEESSNNLTKLINSQISAKDKASLGYDSQMNESEVVHCVFNSRESDVDDSTINDRFKIGEGFHTVPPPYTGNYMPSRPDLSFAGLDDSVYKTKVSKNETSISKTSKDIVEKPKTIRPSAPIIEDWDTNSDNDSVFRPKSDQTKPKVNNVTTAGSKAVVNAAVGNGENAVKSLACWIWRPTRNVIDHTSKDSRSYMLKRFDYGNPQYTLQDQGIFDSGCSRHMTENKSFLTDYQEVNGGFVAFVGSPKGGGLTCLFAKAIIYESNLWHRRIGHINFKTMNKLVRGNLVRGLPSKLFENNHTCVACHKGKQYKASCKTKLVSSISQPLQILHMDLFGPTSVRSINHKTYCLVVTDDYSRCDNGTEFKNNDMNQFCGMKGIKREFSVARTPQQNRVAERKNRTLIEAARTMLADSLLPTTFWAEAVSTACYVQNRVLVTKPHNKTPYELLHGRPPSISFMRPFGCPVTILNTLDPLGKFDEKADEGFFVGYSINSKAFRSSEDAVADDAGKKTNEEPANEGERNGQEKEGGASNKEDDQNVQDFRAELDNLLVQQKEGYANNTNRDSTVSPSVSTVGQIFTNADDLPIDPLIPDLEDTADLLNTVYRNKKDKRGIVVRNKARLVTQGYTQEEGIDYDEVFAPIARIEAIRLFMAYASFMGFIVYQIDVKSAFLYGTIEEEVYVCQPPGFEDPEFPNKVYKVEKTLYGLHQAPRAWYETLSTYVLENGFRRGTIDKTLFIKKDKYDIMLVQVFVNDIIFGSTKKSLCTEFEQKMHKRFQMSSIGELIFFLGLQVNQKDDGIFISQDKYVAFATVKTTITPMETNKALLKDEEDADVDVHLYRSMIGSLMYLTTSRPDIMFVVCACARDSPFDLEAFSDSDYAGASLDRKSTTGGMLLLWYSDIPMFLFLEKFWMNATVELVDNGDTRTNLPQLTGKELTITKASVRRHLNLQCRWELVQVVVLCAKKPWGVPLLRLWSKRVPTLPHDSPLLIVNTLGSDEGSMTLQELTVLCTTLSKKVESLEADLKQTKQVYGAAYTKLIMKVKKLEKTVKTSHSRRRAKIVVSDNEEASEDSSKQGRMREKIDQDVGVNLVTHTQGEDKHDDQLGVLSVTKVLADAAKTNVLTYTRRRRVVSNGSGGISTASRLFSTAEESVSTIGASCRYSILLLREEWGKTLDQELNHDEELLGDTSRERNKYSKADQAKIRHEEVGSSKRAAEAELDHEGSKRQKTNEASGSVQEQPKEEEKELSQEDLQQMMMVGSG